MQAVGGSAVPATPPSLMRLRPMPNQSPPSWGSGTYSYDGSGNIYKIGAAGAESGDGMATTYSYDLLSRLKKVDSTRSAAGASGTARTENYSYDVYGNLTLTTAGDGSQRNLTVAVSSNRYQTSPDTGMAAVYDVAGRMTNYGTDVYKYDAANMMTERDHDGWSDYYVYSADDERVGARVGDTWTWSFREASGKVLRQYQSSASNPSADWLWVEDYIYAGGRLLAAERPAEEGGRRHFHLDHLGTPRLITGAFGELVSQHDMTAFGSEITPPTQELTAGFDREEPMKFTGHERDFTGPFPGSNYLDYMHARGFTPALGRFLSVDPSGKSGKPAIPQSWNRYAYARNNPLTMLDPDGKETVVFIIGASNIVRDLSGAFGHTAVWVSSGSRSNGWSFGGTYAFKKDKGYSDLLRSYQAEGRSVHVFHLKTTPEQDAKMLDYVNKNTPTDFNICTHNCTTTTWQVLQAGGLIPMRTPVYCGFCGIVDRPNTPVTSPEGLEAALEGEYSSIVQREYIAPRQQVLRGFGDPESSSSSWMFADAFGVEIRVSRP